MRLRELTESIPKPFVEIGGKPILWHIMKIYSHYGFDDFILCLGYKGHLIEEYFSRNREKDWRIVFADTGLKTDTGGRIKKIEPLIGEEMFFATYGDGLANIHLGDLLAFHKAKGKMATITCVHPVCPFGVVETDALGLVARFHEKPPLKERINGGFFVFNRGIFDFLREEDVLEKKPFELLAARKEVAAYLFNGFWDCMDTFKDMQMLNALCAEKRAPWKVWEA